MTALGLLAAVVLLLGNGFFVAAEFAAVSVRRAQIEPLAARSRRARRVLDAQRRLSLLLAGAQLGITLCSLGLGAVAEPSVAHLLEKALHATQLPTAAADPLAFAVALALVVLAHMVVGEMVPKNISLATSERAALLLVPALDTFVRATGPLIRTFNAMANGVLRAFGVTPQDELKTAYTSEELADILAESRAEGYLAAGEHQRIASALTLANRRAADVVIPDDRLITVTPVTTAAEIEALTVRTGYSRFPVRAGNGVLGFVHVKDVLVGVPDPSQPWVADHFHPMPSIAAGTPLPDVLTALRRARSHMALVREGGGIVGVLTMEDVVESFIGEISDAVHR
jgi:CBS domain containing-hemolysin-like protein